MVPTVRASYGNPIAFLKVLHLCAMMRFGQTTTGGLHMKCHVSGRSHRAWGSLPAFQAQGEISSGKNALLHSITAGFTPPRLDQKGFAVTCPLALLGSAFYPVLVHRLTIYAPRFLATLGRPRAVAVRFAHCDQLTAGLAPAGVRPCCAHQKKGPLKVGPFQLGD